MLPVVIMAWGAFLFVNLAPMVYLATVFTGSMAEFALVWFLMQVSILYALRPYIPVLLLMTVSVWGADDGY